jgi:hypothetical protein
MTMQPNNTRRLAVVDANKSESTPSSNKLNDQQKAAHQRACNITSRALIAAGGSSIVARKLGKSKQLIADWADPETARALTLRDVVAVGGPFAQSIADQLATVAGEQSMPAVSPQGVLATSAQLTSVMASALADGTLSQDEKKEILQVLQKMIPVCQGFVRALIEQGKVKLCPPRTSNRLVALSCSPIGSSNLA